MEMGSLFYSGRVRMLGAFVLMFAAAPPARSWGTQAHQLVNARAVENLPEPLRTYLRTRKIYLVEHATDPDLVAQNDPSERLHHFTDADAYDKDPFPTLQKHFLQQGRPPTSVERRNGDSIWQIEYFTNQLTAALRRHNWGEADYDAVFLAHYASDLTQPLHTLSNYDGQFTHQAGVHSRFESELVNALKDGWTLKPQPTTNEANLRARIFGEFLASYRQGDAVLVADRRAVAGRTYVDPQFSPTFQKLAGPLAEKRLDAAISFVSSLWYTAWVRAGRPALPAQKAEVKVNALRLADRGHGGRGEEIRTGRR
jgi:hypothetical protein